jgi:hypothetical protein
VSSNDSLNITAAQVISARACHCVRCSIRRESEIATAKFLMSNRIPESEVVRPESEFAMSRTGMWYGSKEDLPKWMTSKVCL